MVANVYVTGKHLIDDAHGRRGSHRKRRWNAGQLSVRKINKKISLVGLKRNKEGALSEHRLQLSHTSVLSEMRITPSQAACCMHVLAVEGFADTVLLNVINERHL